MLQIRYSLLIALHLTTVAIHTVDDILRKLEIKRKNFAMFLSDAARYMSLANRH